MRVELGKERRNEENLKREEEIAERKKTNLCFKLGILVFFEAFFTDKIPDRQLKSYYFFTFCR
jgi:hypothetical protein